jgi:ParB family chromosome partitioning protein
MSSERTLAVQAALMQQPQKAVALMVWRLCTCVFDYGCMSPSHPFEMKVTEHHASLVSEAPAGKTGKAWLALMQEKSRLEGLLPEGWKKDFTTFLTLDGETLMALMAYCTASSVYGVQTRTMGHTTRSPSMAWKRRSVSICVTGGHRQPRISSDYSTKNRLWKH